MEYKEAFVSFLKENRKILKKAAVGIAILMAALLFYLYEGEKAGDITVTDDAENFPGMAATEVGEIATSPESISQEPLDIIIDIGGAVKNPGIIMLKEGGRVYEAVEMAGGMTEQADAAHINLAEKLIDGDKVWIPFIEEKRITAGYSSSKEASDNMISAVVTDNVSSVVKSESSSQGGKVNINTADSQTLQTLNGVGPSTAEKIITYRESSGGFKSVDDLKKVSGIGDKTFEKLKELITV